MNKNFKLNKMTLQGGAMTTKTGDNLENWIITTYKTYMLL